MSNIDWSKGPQDATHFMTESHDRFAGWLKLDGNDWRYKRHHTPDEAWMPIDIEPRETDSIVIRPTPWNGEGLPSVGTVCEFFSEMNDGADWHAALRSGMSVEVIAHFNTGYGEVAAFIFTDGSSKQVEQAQAECFRPIKTAEQIAAEEREKAIEEMRQSLKYPGGVNVLYVCTTLYDLGYRKQEAQ